MWNKKRILKATKWNIILLFASLIVACGNQDDSNEIKITSLNPSSASDKNEIKHIETEDSLSIWIYDSMQDTILKIRQIDKDRLSYQNLINTVNLRFQNRVILDFMGISNDTIYVEIKDSEFLTQQMGSSGSNEYMISATFTLTELDGIEFVNFDFEYGDHANPGTYSRKYFWDRIEENR